MGNIAEARRIRYEPLGPGNVHFGSKLKVQQQITVGENLGINTIFTWDPTYGKDVIDTYISVGHIGENDRISSLSKFEIKKDPTKRVSDKLVYDLGFYDSNDNEFGTTGHMDILKPALFPNVVGIAYEIAFNLFERKGALKPLSPLTTEIIPPASDRPLKIGQKSLIGENL